MRYLFVVNPIAGGKNSYDMLKRKVEDYFVDSGDSFQVVKTEYKGHAEEITRKELESGEYTRVFAVGGDGTLLEVAKGAYGFHNAEVGVFPVGSGNDYIKSYGERDAFLSFDGQIKGQAIPVDLISTDEGIALNICSVGLDAKVAYNMVKFKALPGVGGSLAYDLSLARCLTSKIGEDLTVKIISTEGEKSYSGTYLFALAASGQWYGGGYHGAPAAVTDDGLLDFILIKKPPIHKLMKLVNIYKAGEHMGHPEFKDLMVYHRGTEIFMESQKEIVCNRDGECDLVKKECFKVLPNALKFVLPLGISPAKSGELITERLILRNLKDEDFQDFYEIMSDPLVMPSAGSAVISTKIQGKRLLDDYIKNNERYAICLQSTGKLIGLIKYQEDLRRHRINSRSIGYELNKDYWGQGYMTEALWAMVENAFENLKLDVLGIGHFATNNRSKRVIEKCGFKLEGTIRKALKTPQGTIEDDVSYSITKDEYLEMRGKK